VIPVAAFPYLIEHRCVPGRRGPHPPSQPWSAAAANPTPGGPANRRPRSMPRWAASTNRPAKTLTKNTFRFSKPHAGHWCQCYNKSIRDLRISPDSSSTVHGHTDRA